MKFLHLEDNAHDAELTQLVFAAEWPECEIAVVSSRDDFSSQLEKGGHDIILSDFNLTNFNGLDALQLAHEKAPQIPFIFLSGTIGEDRAIDALRCGASDYVIKDRPKRLIPAVKRALEEARQLREKKEAEEQLFRVQRLENIGMLAAGIAHDFNNVLAPVMMSVPLLRESLADSRDLMILATVEKSVERGADLVRQILGFVQGVTGEAHVIQAKHLLKDLLGVMRQTFPREIQIEDDIAVDLWPLKINPTQLHQVLLNLCVNARDAMPCGGRLSYSARNLQLDEATAAGIPGARPGPYLLFEIADTGTGIEPAVLSKIWTPFFTTKEAGRGTGLGLPTVRSIVENQRGAIMVESLVDQGTRFKVYLPANPSATSGQGMSSGSNLARGSNEMILFVDDDQNVRDVTSVMLTRHGYRVLVASNGIEAIALFASRSLEIRVLLTDVNMPELDGISLGKIVRNLNPAIRILTITGMADCPKGLRTQNFEGRLLLKPFTSEALLTALSELLAPSGAVGKKPR